ncbi:MAG: hypothetical protein A2171_02125 [Candidatus Levybacteria bacterium RBG_13_35_9]|nr:MAG: hypothetical protein A2171_02125 [Candidatus Levybacteria bacterium RBG_13_35_9]
MKNKAIFGSIALDLKRVAIGYYRGSNTMAEKFFEEALKRREELNKKEIKPYLLKFLNTIEKIKNEKHDKAAEDALLYSTIFQNASQV